MDYPVSRLGPAARSRTRQTAERDEEPAVDTRERTAAILALQRDAGNRAVQRLVAEQAGRSKPKTEGDEDKERPKDDRYVQRTPGPPAVALALQRAAFNTTLNKPGPTRSNTAASTTKAKDPTFTGHAVEDKKRKRWTYGPRAPSGTRWATPPAIRRTRHRHRPSTRWPPE